MNEDNATVAATAASIEAAFSGRWGVWRSDTGWWWAARRQALTARQLNAGAAPYLQASSPGELTDRIRAQEQLLASHPEGD